MIDHWSEHGPPVYISVAAYLGMVKPSSGKKNKSGKKETGNLNDLLGLAGPGGMIQ